MKRVIIPHISTTSMLITTCIIRRIRTLVLGFTCAERDICDHIFHSDIRYHWCLTCTSSPPLFFVWLLILPSSFQQRLSLVRGYLYLTFFALLLITTAAILRGVTYFTLGVRLLLVSFMMFRFTNCNELRSTNSFTNVSRLQWRVEDGKSHYLYVAMFF